MQFLSLTKDEVGHERHQGTVNDDSGDHDSDHSCDGNLFLRDRRFVLDNEGQRDCTFDVALESKIEHLFKFEALYSPAESEKEVYQKCGTHPGDETPYNTDKGKPRCPCGEHICCQT